MSQLSTADSLDDYRWLVSPAAREWLALASTRAPALPAQVARLRSSLSPRRTHLVMEQVSLREKAGEKFALAGQMFFTARGLEQSTDEIVAGYKAGRFAGATKILDLCCGIGGDLLALARRGQAVGVDRDPILAIIAEANARALGDEDSNEEAAGQAEVWTRDVESLDVRDCTAWHIDPDRRPQGRRTTRVELYEPPPATIERLLAENPSAAIKLAPAAQLIESWHQQAELEWISRGGQCRQLVAWFGQLAGNCGMRRATVLGNGAGAPRSVVGRGDHEPPIASRIRRYLFEPDAAVLAAGVEGVLAEEHALEAIAPGLAYWTGDRPVVDPALACFQVCDVLPFRIKPLKALLRERGIGRLEIKKRGVDHQPDAVRRQLELCGPESATLLLARVDRRIMAILAQRCNASHSSGQGVSPAASPAP